MNSWRIADRIALKTRGMLMVKLNKKEEGSRKARFSYIFTLSDTMIKEYYFFFWSKNKM